MIRSILTTAALFALTTALGLWLFPIVSGKLSPTASGAVAAYHAINWAIVWMVAAVGAVFAIIARSEFLGWLCDTFWWIDVFCKALASLFR